MGRQSWIDEDYINSFILVKPWFWRQTHVVSSIHTSLASSLYAFSAQKRKKNVKNKTRPYLDLNYHPESCVLRKDQDKK